MGWLPSWLGGESPSATIDPSLRDFLDKEAPTKYTPVEAPAAPPSTTQPPRTQPDPSIQHSSAGETDQLKVPRESLYQDGRYAHLWKTYHSKARIDAETMTEHDKMTNMLETYKERKEQLQQVALENCAEEQEEWSNCMKHGKIEDQLQMCRHQVRRFERCYTMQTRFLRALGYGSSIGRPQSVDEDIQMHADALYQRLIAYEAEAEAAKKEGRPVPVFDPRVPSATRAKEVSHEQESRWKEVLDKLPETDRAVERAALEGDLRTKEDLATNIKQMREEEKRQREASGTPSFGDFLNSLWGGGK